MMLCAGCAAPNPDARDLTWVCDYCGRVNHTEAPAGKEAARSVGRTQLRAALEKLGEKSDFFVGDKIPPSKRAKAMGACNLPANTEIFALVDCTVFGSASNCVLFCEDGIYFHNGWESESPGAHHVAYADMAHAEGGGYHEVAVGQGKSINVAGCALSVEELSTILNAVRNA